jgi:D-alanine-D-alanine ligase
MSKTNKNSKVAVLFGGITVEHEVSVITAVQLMKHARGSYDVTPVYIDKSGKWWTGDSLFEVEYYKEQDLFNPTDLESFALSPNPKSNEIDVAILCFHGQYGESGKVQGILEAAGIPHQGPGVTSAAICFDKIHVRQILKAEGINQPEYVWFTQDQWQSDSKNLIEKIKSTLTYPVFVKPANGGSTVGIQKVDDHSKISEAISQALTFDTRIIVESGITDCIEVNVSVLGYPGKTQASVPEQPISQDEFLSYADKYERGSGKKTGMASANRRIPAPISAGTTHKIQELAQKVFSILGCSGVVRIDFFVNPSTEEMFVIEPNTIPGSMSFYLWEATDLPYPALIDQLIEIAYTRRDQHAHLTHSYESNIFDTN